MTGRKTPNYLLTYCIQGQVTVRVRNCSECLDKFSDRINLIWWCITMSWECHTRIFFCYFQGQGHSHFYCIWNFYTETFTIQISFDDTSSQDRVRHEKILWLLLRRMWLGWLGARLLPLLATLISQAGVDTSSIQENVDRTLLL